LSEELRALGYDGSYDAVRRYAKAWQKDRGAVTAEAYVPLTFAPGEAYRFDWLNEPQRTMLCSMSSCHFC
jgi:hypothetical protein